LRPRLPSRACAVQTALAFALSLAPCLAPAAEAQAPAGPSPEPAGATVAQPAARPLAADAVMAALAPAPEANAIAPWFLGDVDRLMTSALARGAAPGAAVVIGHRGQIVLARGWGKTDRAPGAPEVTEETLWDLASVTKVAATTVAAMVLVQDGALDLDRPLHAYLPEWPTEGARARLTARHLLRHRSGLPPSGPVARGGKDEVVARIAAAPLIAEPGTEERYGDLDMVLLGAVIEKVAGEPLDRLLERRVYDRLDMDETTFRPLEEGFAPADIAPTERLPTGLIHGVVHDPIARGLDGVSGNAGLFSSAVDLARLASALLWEQPDRVVCRDVVNEFTRPVWGEGYALGWESAAPGTVWGEVLSRSAFGHTGYTGTSLWIDPERELFVVLLTNRVNPSARNQRHLELRWALHDAVQRGLPRTRSRSALPDGCAVERKADQLREAIRTLPPMRWLH
jgi:CubicO group peptidase (beta-lactamase class C family)